MIVNDFLPFFVHVHPHRSAARPALQSARLSRSVCQKRGSSPPAVDSRIVKQIASRDELESERQQQVRAIISIAPTLRLAAIQLPSPHEVAPDTRCRA